MTARRVIRLGWPAPPADHPSSMRGDRSSQDELRAAFSEHLRIKREAEAEKWGAYAREHPFAREMVAEADAACRALGWRPKKGKTIEDVRIGDLTEGQRAACEAAQERYQDKIESIAEPAKARADEAEGKLARLAALIELRHGDEPREVRKVDSSTYATQGLGAESYARAGAEGALDVARALGIRCDVEQRLRTDADGKEITSGDSSHWVHRSRTYVALAWLAEELDVEVLRRKHLPLREVVRLMWARGSNPRVHMPFLPHGYEEKVGIDCLGNDLREGVAK